MFINYILIRKRERGSVEVIQATWDQELFVHDIYKFISKWLNNNTILNFCFVLHANDDNSVVSNISEVYSKECIDM